MRKTKPIEQRFWEKVCKTETCWNWIGSKTKAGGYGYLHSGGRFVRKPLKAHRFSWELHNNATVPEGMWVLHKCDNPSCVNPSHLFIGDRTDNMNDCASKKRVCTIGKSRLTHCCHGHEFTESNTRIGKAGHRRCIECAKENDAKRTRNPRQEAIRALKDDVSE